MTTVAAQVSASGSHDGRMRPPVGLRNRWLSKEGTKGGGCCCLWFLCCLCCLWLLSSLDGGGGRWWSTCGGGGFGGLAEAVDNDCVRAHDAHEFSIDLRSQPMPLFRLTKVRAQHAHRRNFLDHVRKQILSGWGLLFFKRKGSLCMN